MKASTIIAGIAVSALAGAVLGVLFAPDKGSNTRKKISEKGSDLANSVKDGYNNLKETVTSKYNKYKEDYSEIGVK